ncbi:hypothetical protein GQ457_05G024640 [Hibiscus cannabinus]
MYCLDLLESVSETPRQIVMPRAREEVTLQRNRRGTKASPERRPGHYRDMTQCRNCCCKGRRRRDNLIDRKWSTTTVMMIAAADEN